MQPNRNFNLLTALLAAALVLAAPLAAEEPEKPQPAPAPSAAAEVVTDSAPSAPAAPDAAADNDAEASSDESNETESNELRRLDETENPDAPSKPSKPRRNRHTPQEYHPEMVKIGANAHVESGQNVSQAVAVLGDVFVEGKVHGEAVAVLGNNTIDGDVTGEAVAVLGSVTINGRVDGEVVAVMGDLTLGPDAVIGRDVVVVGGKLNKSPTAKIGGSVNEIALAEKLPMLAGVIPWIKNCLALGRPLGFGDGMGWAWFVAAGFIGFYMLLALIFPAGINKSVDVLEQRPGQTILAAFLTVLVTPILTVVLAITGIGIILIPFVALAVLLGTCFGKAALLAWFGRRVTRLFGEGVLSHAIFAVLFGGIIVSLLYVIPYLGFLLWKVFGILGLGMVVYAIIVSSKRERPASRPPMPAGAAAAGAAAGAMPAGTISGVTPGAESTASGSSSPVNPPPIMPRQVPISADTLPRAGFWIRVAASLLDLVLIGLAVSMFSFMGGDGPSPIVFALSIYCALMWKFKGTTIGGIICGLKIVRIDDRPIDWGVAVVRVLAGFLSFAIVGLGFIWVAFDDDKQSWHDKIAGTTIVKVPKGTPLV